MIESRASDVVVVGGGPAGSSAALAIARTGLSVVVLERSRYEAARVGEVLAPAARRAIESLGEGAWGSFLDAGHLESPGIASAWGGPELIERDFLFEIGGPAWHLDRRHFDANLARLAEDAGASVIRDARASSWSREPSGSWQSVVEVQGVGRRSHRTRFLIDATGRPSTVARRLGASRSTSDRLVAVIARVPDHDGPKVRDRRMLLEAVENGWWYASAVPGGARVVALMTDADLLPTDVGDLSRAFSDSLGRTRHVREWVGPMVGNPVTLRRVDARTSRLDRAIGAGYLATGDAALALDPLSGSGITRAVRSGLKAAQAAVRHLDRDPTALDQYADGIDEEFARFQEELSRYYGLERRWLDHPFWARRHIPS